MLKHYWKILKDSDNRVEHSLKTQIKEGPMAGGFTDRAGLVHVKYAVYRVTTAIAVYCNEDSVYYQKPEVYEMIRDGLEYVMRNQHENGLFDLINCSLFSAPDTALCVKRMLPCLKYLDNHRTCQQEEEICQVLYHIVKRGAQGLMQGGIQTPNRRQAIASNLMECGIFFGDSQMVSCADQYLADGIDGSDDGEGAKTSAGNYDRINNDAMITMGDVTGNERFYEYAVRSLKMMLTYLEPNGSIFTADATGKDNEVLINARDYYMQYLDMGYRRSIPEFLDMANFIFKLIEEKQITAPDFLIHMMNRPDLKNLEHEGCF